MSCWDTIAEYGLRSLGIGERLLPRSDFTLCQQFTLIGSGMIWNVYFGVWPWQLVSFWPRRWRLAKRHIAAFYANPVSGLFLYSAVRLCLSNFFSRIFYFWV